MEKAKITIEQLRTALPGTYLATGSVLDFRLHEYGEMKWVAVKLESGTQWVIFYSFPDRSEGQIIDEGHKVESFEIVRSLVDCDNQVLDSYFF